MFIQTDVNPQSGDAILDLGCGTGELSAYLAELVEPAGYVVSVDPDVRRLNLAKATHRDIENLSFVEGNSDNFDGMGCEKYDIVFLNQVLHWIPNKQQAFKNMFSSLKEGGKIAIQYTDHLHPSWRLRLKNCFLRLNSGLKNEARKIYFLLTRTMWIDCVRQKDSRS